ncbi:penicillin acylase family protein [Pseudomonas sp. F1_0610]|uniref:penicillin acylase family protein n=1 Tax=Pseudomonas sp. F1_0610 TaxID=3114284 RepID=UPI0039C47C30
MKRLFYVFTALVLIIAAAVTFHLRSKFPQREGSLVLAGLSALVTVNYDQRGIPHIQAQNELDMYRALGYVQAQDRLFQMEMLRRLSRGQLAEILGPDLVPIDRVFRTLRVNQFAQQYSRKLDLNSPEVKALQAYLDGINSFQDNNSRPLEFEILGIEPRPFTIEDTIAAAGYLAFSFANAFKTEPSLTYIRDELGPEYLAIFDFNFEQADVDLQATNRIDWAAFNQLAYLTNQRIMELGLPQFEGSNAWVIAGNKTASGKPLLAGDPHISFSTPAVWYEASLKTPDFELYGFHAALIPFALLGHNQEFGWSLTMFQNDDIDFIAQTRNPDNPDQVRVNQQWVNIEHARDEINVKGQAPVILDLASTPYGPIINPAIKGWEDKTPISMWWALTETDNPLLSAIYQLNRANTVDKAEQAVQQIHSPGLNVVWANAQGDIAWWAAGALPIRPEGVNSLFILNADKGEAEKFGIYDFSYNPKAINPAQGYIVSANYQTASPKGIEIPGYYNVKERGLALDKALRQPNKQWTNEDSKALQLMVKTDHAARTLQPLLQELADAAQSTQEQQLIASLSQWQGEFQLDSVNATLYYSFLHQLLENTLKPALGAEVFNSLMHSHNIDNAIPNLTANKDSIWWQSQGSRANAVKLAWQQSIVHLTQLYGSDPQQWAWSKVNSVSHKHPLGHKAPLDKIFDVGPFPTAGSRELPNNQAQTPSLAPWKVVYGPSTRRVIDFAQADQAQAVIPVGQSGVLFDKHYNDQAQDYLQGKYRAMWLKDSDIASNTQSTLTLIP